MKTDQGYCETDRWGDTIDYRIMIGDAEVRVREKRKREMLKSYDVISEARHDSAVASPASGKATLAGRLIQCEPDIGVPGNDRLVEIADDAPEESQP